MSFKTYLEDTFTVRTPKPHSTMVEINLSSYKKLLENSILKHKKSIFQTLVSGKGEIPVFCPTTKRFFVVELSDKKKKAREVKSREDKEMCGVLLNAMLNEQHTKNNTTLVEEIKTMKVYWEVPQHIYKIK